MYVVCREEAFVEFYVKQQQQRTHIASHVCANTKPYYPLCMYTMARIKRLQHNIFGGLKRRRNNTKQIIVYMCVVVKTFSVAFAVAPPPVRRVVIERKEPKFV